MEGGRLQTGCAGDIQEDLAPHLLTDVPCHCCAVIQPHHTCVFTIKEQMWMLLVEVRCVSRCSIIRFYLTVIGF